MTIEPLDPDVVAADLRPPALADLARRARRRTRRRRVTGAVAVLAAVTTVGAVALAVVPGNGRPAGPAATGRPAPIPGFPIVLSPRVALWVVPGRCRFTVQRTIDAGGAWTPPGGPPPLDGCDPGPDGESDVTYTILDPDRFRFRIADTAWFTDDAGLTWTRPPGDDVLADTLLPGSVGLSLDCEEGCERPRSIDPASGRSVVSRTAPPFARLRQAFYADRNTIWVVSAPERGTPLRAARSDDLGRTWSAAVELPTPDYFARLVAAGPRRAYVVARPENRGSTVHRTDDGGLTWTELAPPTDDVSGFAENDDGNLVLTGREIGPRIEAWKSTDGGATFTGPTPVDAPGPLRSGWAPGSVWASGGDNVLHVYDGGNGWKKIKPPA